MRNAYIEVKTEANSCQKVAAALRNMPGIKDADALFGDVDVMAVAEVSDDSADYLDELEALIESVKELSGVVTTVTRPVKSRED